MFPSAKQKNMKNFVRVWESSFIFVFYIQNVIYFYIY